MHDEQGATPKVMCVPAGDPRLTQLTDIGDLDHFYRLEIQHFFQIYKALEPGKRVEIEDDAWAGRDVAEMEIRRALDHATATTTMDRADPSPAESVDAELVGRLVERARTAGLRLTGEGGLPQQLTKRVLEAALDGEITDHVGSCPVAN